MRHNAACVVVQRYTRRRLAREKVQNLRIRLSQQLAQYAMCAQQAAWAAKARGLRREPPATAAPTVKQYCMPNSASAPIVIGQAQLLTAEGQAAIEIVPVPVRALTITQSWLAATFVTPVA